MTTSQPLKTILFDLDGTLIDSAPGILHSFKNVLTEARIEPLRSMDDSLIGPPLRQTMKSLTGLDDSSELDFLIERFKKNYDEEGFQATRVYDQVQHLLESLHSMGLSMAIATNKRRIPTLKILKCLNWTHLFTIVGTLDSITPHHGDKTALITSVLLETGALSETTLYVGDNHEDGLAAQANNLAFVAAGWGYGYWDKTHMPQTWHLSMDVTNLIEYIEGRIRNSQ